MVNYTDKDRGRQFVQPNLPSTSHSSQPNMMNMTNQRRPLPTQQIQNTSNPPNIPSKSRSKNPKSKNKLLLADLEHRTQTNHDYPKEKRTLRKNNLGAPDVFPQESTQEEDSMSHEKIKKGFIPQILPCETQSALSRFEQDTEKFTDDILGRIVRYTESIIPDKNELAIPNTERRKLNDIKFMPYSKDIVKSGQWFTDLCRGKAYHILTKRVPMLTKFEEIFDVVFEHKVPIPQAIWYISTHYVGQMAMSRNSSKKLIELPDYTLAFSKFIKDTLEKIDEDQPTSRQKFKYVTMLIKNAVNCGMVDKQEFLYELCEQLHELHQKPIEKAVSFRMLLSYVSLFTKEIVSNVVIARKYLHLTGLRLKAYVDEYEKKRKVKTSPYKILSDLIDCVHHRPIILTCIGLATAILIDCPVAAIWTPLEEANFVPFLVGTPLDLFPIDPMHFSVLCKYSTEFSQNLRTIMARRLDEIKERSFNVDQRWALNCTSCTGFQVVMRAAIDVISLLDTADVYNPKSILPLYAKVYGLMKDLDSFEDESVIRTKIMFHWAITNEREGSHRALLVTRLIKLHMKHFRSTLFDGKSITQIIVDFLNKEGPTPDKKYFSIEFGNLILLLIELQRLKVITHDEYVNLLIRYNVINTNDPIITRLRRYLDTKEVVSNVEAPDSDPLVVSFIPTPKKSSNEQTEYSIFKENVESDRPFMDKPMEMTLHERILIHLPIEQVEANRGMVNQRAIMLHGITDDRELAKTNVKKFVHVLIKTWNKHVVQFYNSSKAIKRKHNQSSLNKALQEFKAFTYYDQLVIAGMCSDKYSEWITEFPKTTNIQPNMECLDMLLAMFEQSQCIGECMQFISELLPIIYSCENAMDEFRTDSIPGSFSSQQAFVIVGFLADHYKYFLLNHNNVKITNGLYRLVEKEIKLEGYPISCWAKTVTAFLFHTRYDLRYYSKNHPFAFTSKDCKRIMPTPANNIMDYKDVKYNPKLFDEMLSQLKRCISYHEYKIRLPSLSDKSSKYSFVINAFRTIKDIKNDYEKISELANICGHVSAQKDMSSEWLIVIENLCSPVHRKLQLPGFDQLEPVTDLKTHFFYSTFITLLASRYCFSAHELFLKLNNNAIALYVNHSAASEKSSQKKPSHLQILKDNKEKLLLTLQIITNIVTASDEPLQLSNVFFYPTEPKRTYILQRPAEIRCLKILHIRELHAMILSILTNLLLITDNLKKEDTLKEVHNFLFNSILIMSDQEWIIERMFQICQNDREIEDFNTGTFNRDSLGQYLLRIALRRQCERDVKIELINSNGSKKVLVDKLFSVLTIWNIRASYCDFKVMTTQSKTRHQQQNMLVANALVTEISKSCRDFFFSAEKLNEIKAPQISMFELSDLNSYWLISELLDLVQPENVTKTIKALFLEEMMNLISTSQLGLNDEERMKRLKQSAKLLGEQPFINVILTCQNNEDKGREGLVQAMLNFCQEVMFKYEKQPELAIGPQYELERESMLLRLNLIGGMIDFNTTTPDTISSYAVALCSLLMNDVITKERDGVYYWHVYDMLTICVYSFFSGPGVVQYNEKSEIIKVRYPDYFNFLKKFKREFNERQIPLKLNCIQQLLPVKDNYGELQIFNDTYSLVSPSKGSSSKNNPMAAGYARNIKNTRIDKFAEPTQKRLLRMIYHTHQNEFVTQGTPGKALSNQQLESYVVGPPDYLEASKIPPHMMQSGPNMQHPHLQVRPNFPMHGQAQQQFYPGQNMGMDRPPQQFGGMPPNSGPPNTSGNMNFAGNFPGGPLPAGSMMPPNFPPSSQPMQPPMSHPGPMPPSMVQGQQHNFPPNIPMSQPGPQGSGFPPIPPRMPMNEQMIRQPMQQRPGPVRKRPSANTLAPPAATTQRPKRMRKDTEPPPQIQQPPMQPPQPQMPPPGFYQPSQQQQQWNQGGPSQPPQQFNMNQPQPPQPPRFPSNPQQNQQQETKEILRSTLQNKKKKEQAIHQLPTGQIRQPMMQNMQAMNQMQGQRMPMNMPPQQPGQIPQSQMHGHPGQFPMQMPNQQQQQPPHNFNPQMR